MKPYSLSIKVIITDPEGRCLLLKRSESSKNNPGKWDLPGGKMDSGEQFEETLRREVVEETGLTMQLTGLAGSVKSESPLFNIVNVVMTGIPESFTVCLSFEHQDFHWFYPHEIKALNMVEHFQKLMLNHFGISDG